MAELSDEENFDALLKMMIRQKPNGKQKVRAERILDLRIKKQELTDKIYRLNRQLAKVYKQLDAEMR